MIEPSRDVSDVSLRLLLLSRIIFKAFRLKPEISRGPYGSQRDQTRFINPRNIRWIW